MLTEFSIKRSKTIALRGAPSLLLEEKMRAIPGNSQGHFLIDTAYGAPSVIRIKLTSGQDCDILRHITNGYALGAAMSVRKRKWITRSGEAREAWIVDYSDQDGDRHIRTFDRKKDADAFEATTRIEVVQGIHTAAKKSITVRQAADDWLTYVELEGRERSTIAQYRQHVRLHIVPRLGSMKLSDLSMPRVQAFRDELLGAMSRPLARKVLVSFKSILRDARRRGNVAQNVADGVTIGIEKRGRAKLKAGVDFPTTDEVRRIIGEARGRMRALLVVAVFTGMRASELRGLTWADIDLRRGDLHVRQRADRYGEIGAPKSVSSERTIPIGPMVVNTLKEWKLACPKTVADIVFPTSNGKIDHHKNIVRAIGPVLIRAGVVDGEGKPKYAMHAFRHFFASWCASRRVDGGLELPMKVVQERLGHATIVMTSDTYAHMFPRSDDGTELAAAEKALLG